MVDYAVNRKAACPATHNLSRDESFSFAGASFAQAIRLAHEGWPQGSERMRALSAMFQDKVTSLVEQFTIPYNVTGSDFDVSLVNQGIPEHWYTIQSHLEEGAGTKACRIVLNCSVSGGISKAGIEAKGAAVMALVECLEYSGVRCQVELVEYTYGDYDETRYEAKIHCIVKLPEQPLEYDRLAFILAHPATERRLCFGVQEAHENFCKGVGGYGVPFEVDPKDIHYGDIHIGGSLYGQPHWESSDEIIKWILEQLKIQGVKLEGLEEN